MAYAYLALTLILSTLQHKSWYFRMNGLHPFPGAAMFQAWVSRAAIMAASIHYCGWIYGPAVGFLSWYGIIFLICGWVLSIPSLIAWNHRNIPAITMIEGQAFLLLTPVYVVFTIVSFFIVPGGSIVPAIDSNRLLILAVAVVLGVLRFAFQKILEKLGL